MKSPKDIEKLTLQELEAISLDESIAVPPDLSERIGARISKVKNKGYTIVGAAAALIKLKKPKKSWASLNFLLA